MFFNYGSFNLYEELLGRARWWLPRNLRNCLCHNDDSNVVSAQLPIACLQPRYLSLRAFEGIGKRESFRRHRP